MGNFLHVQLVYGVDYGPKPPARVHTLHTREDVYGEDRHGCTFTSPDDSDHRVLYVTRSLRDCADQEGLPLRAVTHARASARTLTAWRCALDAYAQRYRLPKRAPGWFLITEIG